MRVAEYLMENDDENQRLEIKTKVAVVEEFARRAGLSEGMRVVDAGCGPGLTTSVLSSVVGHSGYALGFDIAQSRIERAKARHENATTAFTVGDFNQAVDSLGLFDFVWSRFTLEYYKRQGQAIVSNLASLAKPGAAVCLIDLDHNCLSHHGMSQRLATAFDSAVRQLEDIANFDPYSGRKLYSYLKGAGIEDIQVWAGAHHLIYGELSEADEFNWGKKLEVIAKKLPITVPGYSGADEFYEDFMKFFKDPDRFSYTPVIMAWGRKPR